MTVFDYIWEGRYVIVGVVAVGVGYLTNKSAITNRVKEEAFELKDKLLSEAKEEILASRPIIEGTIYTAIVSKYPIVTKFIPTETLKATITTVVNDVFDFLDDGKLNKSIE